MATITRNELQSELETTLDDSLRFERRNHDRWEAEGVATVFQLDGDDFGRMHTLRMLDFSADGMGSICETHIEPGSQVSIGFQSPGRLAKRGIVTRCQPCGHGYRVGIQFEARLAA